MMQSFNNQTYTCIKPSEIQNADLYMCSTHIKEIKDIYICDYIVVSPQASVEHSQNVFIAKWANVHIGYFKYSETAKLACSIATQHPEFRHNSAAQSLIETLSDWEEIENLCEC